MRQEITWCLHQPLVSPELKDKIKKFSIATAKELGMLLASKAKDKGIEQVVFDRGGYKYHGKIKALADAAREGGLEVLREELKIGTDREK